MLIVITQAINWHIYYEGTNMLYYELIEVSTPEHKPNLEKRNE